ncbi:hypothetical protein V8J88_21390 [Massilia sp. W12]|uniref:hypothetical protein n=1 Tax=Massilia sp. W12 TaxID=3126507 RepID=UPI0030CE74EB
MPITKQIHPLFLITAAIWLSVSLFVAGGVLYIEWIHNPQGEFHDITGINWGNWLPTGAILFVITGGPLPLIFLLLYLTLKVKICGCHKNNG